MAALRVPTLRHALNRSETPLLRAPQRRWAQVHDVRFLTTHQPPSEKVFEKYKHKLEKKAKELGIKDAEELKKVLLEKNKPPQQASRTSSSISSSAASTSPFPSPPPPPLPQQVANPSPTQKQTPTSPSTQPGVKTLSSFLNVPKILELPPKEIESLWRLRHASSPRSLCANIPTHVYRRIEATARKHPQFILPLPREQKDEDQNNPPGSSAPTSTAAEIHFLQWTFPTPETATVLFTHLAEYKLRGEYAQPHTTVTHHLELADAKGLVLLQGTVMEDRGVSVEEGRWLLMCLQKFYGGIGGEERGAERVRLLRQFSEGAEGFKLEALLQEAEKIV